MALVDYASSEESDQDVEQKPTQLPAKSKPPTKAIPKLVDSSNPGKIRVGIGITSSGKNEDSEESERPTKRAKVGAGGFSDFNALLPAPKRPDVNKSAGGAGLGRGVNLKTGATPGFTRERLPDNNDPPPQGSANHVEEIARRSSEAENETNHAGCLPRVASPTNGTPEPPKKKATIFKPLSVSRKPQKKKPPLAPQTSDTDKPISPQASADGSPSQASKVSLFSVASGSDGHDAVPNPASNETYQPMLYQPERPDPDPKPTAEAPLYEDKDGIFSYTATNSEPHDQDQSLEAIANSLSLTPSQKRQLLGRNASKSSSSQAIKITNFNTDAEYASNEALRQAGEVVQHQPVRAITGGGKHSLKQLVNSAVGQKDALDESFAEGRRNRKEGANKYGW